MRGIKLASAVCGLWLLGVQPAAAEDLTIVSEIVVPRPYIVGPKSGPLTLWMSSTRVKQSDGYRDWIYDVPSGKQIDIDHQKGVYWEGTVAERAAQLQDWNRQFKAKAEKDDAEYRHRRAKEEEELAKLRARAKEEQEQWPKVKEELKREWSKLTPQQQDAILQEVSQLTAERAKRVNEAKAKLSEELAKLPQALLDNIGKPIPPLPTKYSTAVEKGSGSKTIAGYDCIQHLVWSTNTFADGSKKTELVEELWVAPNLEVPVSFEVLKLAPFVSGVYVVKEGFALGSIHPRPGGSIWRSVLAIEIKKGPIDPSVFAVPVGYTKVDQFITQLGSYSSSDPK